MLNVTFLGLVLESYTNKEMWAKNHYLLSLLLTPDEFLSEYPRVRISIAGLDPIRDDQIRLMYRLTQCNVDVQAIEYQYLMHAFLGQHLPPISIEEAAKAVARSIEFVRELMEDE